MKEFIEKRNTHIVIKFEDMESALSSSQLNQLQNIINFIGGYRKANGKQPFPKYVVINEDEPYIYNIRTALKDGELAKRGGSDFK